MSIKTNWNEPTKSDIVELADILEETADSVVELLASGEMTHRQMTEAMAFAVLGARAVQCGTELVIPDGTTVHVSVGRSVMEHKPGTEWS